MKTGLKIYACTGLNTNRGVGETPAELTYWQDNTTTAENTKAVNSLLADINHIFAQLQYKEDITESEIIEGFNLVDLYIVCLRFAQELKNASELERAGRIVGQMLLDGEFDCYSTSNKERDEHLDLLIETAEALFLAGENPQVDTVFTQWFYTNVSSQNIYGFTKAERQRSRRFLQTLKDKKRISGTEDEEEKTPSDYLYDAGGYYLYLYTDEATAKKAGYMIWRKWKKEKETYEYTHRCYDRLFANPESVDKIIYDGVSRYYKHTPEFVMSKLTNGKGKNSIGDFGISAILSIIAAVAAVLTAILKVVLAYCAEVQEAKYTVPVEPASGTPEEYDWGNSIEDTEEEAKKKKYLKWGIIGAIALFIFKSK